MPSARSEIERLLNEFGPRIEAAFMAAIRDVTDQADLRAIEEALRVGDLEAALDALHLDPAAFRGLEAEIEAAFGEGGASAIQEFPTLRGPAGFRIVQRFDVRNPEAERWLAQQSSTRITGPSGIIEGIRESIRPVLAQSLEAGRGPRATALDVVGRTGEGTSQRTGGLIGLSAPQTRTVDTVRRGMLAGDPEALRHYLGLKTRDKRFDRTIAKAIREGKPLSREHISRITGRLSDKYLQLRGETIARTETLSALNASRHEAFRQGLERTNYGPDQVIKIWDSAGDSRVRHTHAALDGDRHKDKRVRGLESAFQSPSGALMRFPGDASLGAGPEEIIACRCVVRYVVDVFGDR